MYPGKCLFPGIHPNHTENHVKRFCGNSSKISINSRLPHLKAVLISPPFNPSWSDISLKLKFLPIKNPRTEDKSLYYAREMQIYSAGGVQNFHPFQVNEHQNHDFCLDFHTVYRFWSKLRVVDTLTILLLKPMSETVGSDIERRWNWIYKDDPIQIQSRSMSDPTLSDIDFKNKMAFVRTTLKSLVHQKALTWSCIIIYES